MISGGIVVHVDSWPAFPSSRQRARVRRRAAVGDRRRRRHAALRLQRGDAPRALPRASTTRSAAIRTRCTTRSRPTPTLRARAAAARARQRASTPTRSGRSSVARRAGFAPGRHRVHRRRQVATRSSSAPCRSGCKAINVESAGELARVEAIAARLGVAARVAVRINPDIDAKSHPHISTGLKINKFGVPLDDARELLRRRSRTGPSLRLVAIHVHVGSQITTLEPLRRAAAFVAGTARRARSARASRSSTSTSAAASASPTTARRRLPPAEYVGGARRRRSARPACRSSSSRAARSSAPPARCSRASSTSSRATPASEFAVIDAGMTELLRPALYDAFHRIEPVQPRGGREPHVRDRRPGLREQRRRRPRPRAAAARSRRSRRHSRRRRLRIGDGVELQSPPAARRGAGRRRALARHPPPPDGRRHAGAGVRLMAGHLIAFEGLDQSGKQTQAELLRDRLKQRGPQGAAGVVSRLRHVDRRGDRARARRASASTAPTSCSCSTSPTATSGRPICSAGSTAG